MPTVLTDPATDITPGGFNSGGNTLVSTDDILQKGIIIHTSSTFDVNTVGIIKIVVGAGSNNFWTTVTGLSPQTTYYVRAYIYNGSAYGYGSPVEVTTAAGEGYITTSTPTTVSGGIVEAGGESLSVLGGFDVIEKGLV
jgi:hypothetical protein